MDVLRASLISDEYSVPDVCEIPGAHLIWTRTFFFPVGTLPTSTFLRASLWSLGINPFLLLVHAVHFGVAN